MPHAPADHPIQQPVVNIQSEESSITIGLAMVRNLPPEGSMLNARIAAARINNTILLPGEVLSFNETVGPRTLEQGFVTGYSIVGSELVPDVGGGVCRTSTALYWAVKEAGLKTLERHNHTEAIPYAPEGTDAAVWWGKLDYRCQNTSNEPVQILSGGHDDQIWVAIQRTGF